MWNWVLSSLYFNSTLVLYEGSPFYPNKDSLLEIIDENNINIFGTSAKYISYIQSEKLSLINKFKFNIIITQGFKKVKIMNEFKIKYFKTPSNQ